jgi:hypothetical protein
MNDTSLTPKQRRWKIKKENTKLSPRTKETRVDGHSSKRAISTVVGMSLDGDLLPLQMIYRGKTSLSLPEGRNPYVQLARAADWVLTNKDKNHWSSADTMMTYIRKVLIPYRDKIIREENIDVAADVGDPKVKYSPGVILLIDCWSMHVHTLKPMIEREFPFIHLSFVPANCTSKLQPCDVIANAPLKRGFKKRCIAWTARRAMDAIEQKIPPDKFKIAAQMSVTKMKPLLIEWLYESWMELKLNVELLTTGWAKCGLDKIKSYSRVDCWNLSILKPEVANVMYGSNCKRMPTTPDYDESDDDNEDEVVDDIDVDDNHGGNDDDDDDGDDDDDDEKDSDKENDDNNIDGTFANGIADDAVADADVEDLTTAISIMTGAAATDNVSETLLLRRRKRTRPQNDENASPPSLDYDDVDDGEMAAVVAVTTTADAVTSTIDDIGTRRRSARLVR